MRRFDEVVLSEAKATLLKRGATREEADEIAQRVRVTLFAGPQPKIGDFRGSGSFIGWVRTFAVRAWINERTRGAPRANAADALLATIAPSTEGAESVSHRQLAPIVRTALREGLASLTPRERSILQFVVVDGTGLEQVASVYRVHRTTVMRWLERALDEVRTKVRRAIERDAGLTASDVESALDYVARGFDTTLTRYLDMDGHPRAEPSTTDRTP